MQIGDKVKFIGYPTYKRGLKGEVTYISPTDPNCIRVDFINSTWIMTEVQNVEQLNV